MRRDRVAKLHAAMEAAGVDTLVLVRPAERLVRDRRARPGRRPRARVVVARGRGARTRARRGRISTPTSPRARRPSSPTSSSTARSRSRPRRARPSCVAQARRGPRRRSTTRPFPLWQALRGRDARRRGRRCSAPAKLTKTPDELECIRQAQAINEEAMRVGPAARGAGRLARPTSRARSSARSPSSARPRTPSTRCSR